MLELAIMAGIGIDEFWSNTPRINTIAINAFQKTQEYNHNQLAWAAWHIGAFARIKKMPPLKDLLAKTQKQNVGPQSECTRMAMVEIMNAAFGGKDTRKHNG